jgi:23S rRNA (uracil1939-C5)-methyltransferase
MKRPKPQVRRSSPAESRLVQIEKPIYGGSFLARDEGKAVFVPFTLPGERVDVRIVEEKRGFATAEIEEIKSAAPERVTPNCRHFGECGGCHYQHTDYETQLKLKQLILRETLERAGVRAPQEIAVLSGKPWEYRNRIRLALDQRGDPGYRGRRTHAVIPIEECPIAAPLLVQAARAAGEFFRKSAQGMRPTELALFCNTDESELLASVFAAIPEKRHFDNLSRELSARIPALRGMELVAEDRSGRSAKQIAQWGEASLIYRAGSIDYRVDHGSFFQVNRWLVDALLEQVTASQKGRLAWDLFAGVGLFARRLTASFERVVAVESAASATSALAENLKGTSGEGVTAETLDYLRRNGGSDHPDLIVIDPPRTGLGAETCTFLAEAGAPRLVYVSCDPATLARDLRALIGSGYEMDSMTLADLFPQTFHLETVVHLRRS